MSFGTGPPRTTWGDFPDVVLHAEEQITKRHALYKAAKSGDADAAIDLVIETISEAAVSAIARLAVAAAPTLISAHAFEREGVNAIPEALADELGTRLGWPVDRDIVQINVVAHTGANGFHRLANQAAFEGSVARDGAFVLVDDFVGQGGTLANLKGFVETQGGRVIGATALTGKPYSAILKLAPDQLAALRAKHGKDLEIWWYDRFGHSFDCLTQSEARYLERTKDADTVRSRIIAAEQARDRGTS